MEFALSRRELSRGWKNNRMGKNLFQLDHLSDRAGERAANTLSMIERVSNRLISREWLVSAVVSIVAGAKAALMPTNLEPNSNCLAIFGSDR